MLSTLLQGCDTVESSSVWPQVESPCQNKKVLTSPARGPENADSHLLRVDFAVQLSRGQLSRYALYCTYIHLTAYFPKRNGGPPLTIDAMPESLVRLESGFVQWQCWIVSGNDVLFVFCMCLRVPISLYYYFFLFLRFIEYYCRRSCSTDIPCRSSEPIPERRITISRKY